ncbi:hypothetical protein GCM10020220_054340 [Nonomuraea rubra]|uniref:cellulose binding domain-containing protein n=1 Tax=Nonomuraea rubra TaxID=46180 RepID=UPI0031EC0F61
MTSQWSGGFQGEVTVKNTGSAQTSSWRVGWTLPGGQTISQLWNGTLSGSSGAVSVTNLNWNGTLAAGASTTFGFLVNGQSGTPSTVTCTSS